MNVIVDIQNAQPKTAGAIAFLAPKDKKMLIGGAWVDAVSGKRLDSIDPATGQVIGTIPAGSRADVDLAVKAARESFEKGVWRDKTPDERARVLWKIADLIEANIDELAEVKLAILEPSGQLSVVRQDWAREARLGDLRAWERGGI